MSEIQVPFAIAAKRCMNFAEWLFYYDSKFHLTIDLLQISWQLTTASSLRRSPTYPPILEYTPPLRSVASGNHPVSVIFAVGDLIEYIIWLDSTGGFLFPAMFLNLAH
jgi:hypothetical protein